MTDQHVSPVKDGFEDSSNLVLAVDDAPENLRLLEATIRAGGYIVRTAASGEECLSLLNRMRPRLILLDIEMPGMDGFEACRIIRSKTELRRTPVAFITARKTLDDVKKCLEVGGNDFIVKPFDVVNLLERIRHWTDHAEIEIALEEEHTKLEISNLKLRQTTEYLGLVQRVAGIGGMVVDLATESIEWSPEACSIFGVDKSFVEPTFEYLLGFVHPDDREMVTSAALSARSSGLAARPLEYRIIRPGGALRVVYRENAIRCDASDQPISLILTFKDITQLKESEWRREELERQLRHSQKLEALGTLAGGIAHDLNNTLVPVLALSQMLMDSAAEEDRQDLQIIVDAARRAKELVQQILAFSRKQEIQKAETDPAAVVRQALQMMRATMPPNIAVIEAIGSVPPILADAGQLQQVVVNLVTNAAQAIGTASASITVEVSAIAAAGSPELDGGFVRIQVADTGCGMETATLERIFEPFFTTKGVGEGTGLGLSVVHGIVTGHDGTIEAASEPGKGTIFTILLPVADRASATLEAAAA